MSTAFSSHHFLSLSGDSSSALSSDTQSYPNIDFHTFLFSYSLQMELPLQFQLTPASFQSYCNLLSTHYELSSQKNPIEGEFPGGPVVKTPPSNAGSEGCIPGWGTKIPHATELLSLCATSTGPIHSGARAPQQ